MADDHESARSFFEPPEWWKKWRPLRWILAALVFYWVYTLLPQADDAPAPANTAPDQKVVAEAPATPAPPAVQKTVPAVVQPKPAQPVTTPVTPPAAPPITPAVPKPQVVPAPAVAAPVAPAPVVIPPTPAKPVQMTPAPVKTTPAQPATAPAPVPAVVPSSPRPQNAAPVAPVQKPVPEAKPAPAVPAAQKQPSTGSTMVDTLPESGGASSDAADAERAAALAPYTAVAKDTVALMNGMRSYSSVQTVTAQLRQHGYTWKAEQIARASRRTYPPYRTDTLTVASYRHLGEDGTLTLEFFNDRLYETNFVPVRAAKYLQLLRNQGVPLRRRESGRSELTQGNLLMETNIDFATSEVGTAMHLAPYLFWRDARLVQQLRNWGPLP